MRYFVTIGKRVLEVELGPEGIKVEGEPVNADLVEMDGTEVHSLLFGRTSHRILASRNGSDEWIFHLSGTRLKAHVIDERTRTIRDMAAPPEGSKGPGALRAPMPGLVVKVEVREGDPVEVGQGLVIVEAMKMENELKSEGAGVVGKVLVVPGQAVEKDQVLVEFQPQETPGQKGSEE